jgi:hypothetical protein
MDRSRGKLILWDSTCAKVIVMDEIFWLIR